MGRVSSGSFWWSFALLGVALGCGSPLAPETDAGVMVDGGSFDAGVSTDAGAATDAGSSADAGSELDAGSPPIDGGSELDAGMSDAGSVIDGGSVDAGADAGAPSDAGTDGGAVDAGLVDAGSPGVCVPSSCGSRTYACGDCIDNDADGRIDSDDPECTGSCDNSEETFGLSIPGQTSAPCRLDCYFDADTGSGNDECYWDQRCDPLAVPPDYYPSGSAQCVYNPATMVGSLTCSGAMTLQSSQCTVTACGPIVPNGCDCFGCCSLPGVANPVYLGTNDATGATCTTDAGTVPSRCAPCTQVASCLNTCDTCELCVGKTTLPAQCFDGGVAPQQCPSSAAACGLPGQAACAPGQYCVTGCCRQTP